MSPIYPAERVPLLPSDLRDRLLRAWIRWGDGQLAEAAVHAMIGEKGELVTYLDRLAEAVAAQGRHAEAAAIIQRRRAIRDSASSAASEARAWLAAGDLESARTALDESEQLSNTDQARWLRFELALAEEDWRLARAQIEAWEAQGTPATLSQARLALACGDVEQAAALARRYLDRPAEAPPVPVATLRELHELAAKAGDPATAAQCAQALETMQQKEIAGLVEALKPYRSLARRSEQVSITLPPLPRADIAPTEAELARLSAPMARVFGHQAFRPGQAEVMAALLRGQNVLAVMPTGAGKSLCYQLPAMLLPGATLVVSPLIALMKDQVDGLPDAMRHTATFVNSSLDGDELRDRLGRAAAGHFKLIYAAPERLRQPPFLHALAEAGLSCFVIDEAHCVSLWGHDFRPDYLFMAEAHKALGSPTLLAMTATAPPRVQHDIQQALGELGLVITDVHRPNLRMACQHLPNEAAKLAALLAICKAEPGSGIVYANSRQKCEELAWLLQRNGHSAVHYHAGIDNRAEVQDLFMSGKRRIVVATVAFGMGIDKADIRFIVHFHPPRSLESYTQEAGRAGRDGLPSRCVLFYSTSDRTNLRRWAKSDAITIDFLRETYGAVKRRLPNTANPIGPVALADLQRDLRQDEDTRVRVALSLLEEASLLRRGFDIPRAAVITLHGQPDGDPALTAFADAARLRPGQALELSLTQVAGLAGLDAFQIERQVLRWQGEGKLQARLAGRDMLLGLSPRPADATQRIERILQRYDEVAQARIAEMVDYASTTACRHAHISAYFGSPPVTDCRECDNCDAPPGAIHALVAPKRTGARKRSGDEITATILRCARELSRPVGRMGLVYLLAGSVKAPPRLHGSRWFGQLEDAGPKALIREVDRLTEAGLLEVRQVDGFPLIFLTAEGKGLVDESA